MTSTKAVDVVGATVAGASPLWLPLLHQVSDLAALVVPILGAILLIIRIVFIVHAYRRGRWRGWP